MRPGVHNLILLLLILVVVGVTSLNHYTTRQSTAYFTEVSQQEAREMQRSAIVGYAQFLAGKSLIIAQAQATGLVRAETQVIQYMNLCKQFAGVIQQQAGYIADLEQALKQRNIPLPTKKAEKPAGKNLQASVSRIAPPA